MQYFVISPDGSKYGPADIPTLKQWAAENRLFPNSMLEDFGTGQRMEASQVQGIFSDAAPPPSAAGTMAPGTIAQPGTMAPPGAYNYSQAPAGYPRAGGQAGQQELTLAWVFAVLSLVICVCGWVFGPLAVWKANQASALGNPGYAGPRAIGLTMTVIGTIITVIRVIQVISIVSRLH